MDRLEQVWMNRLLNGCSPPTPPSQVDTSTADLWIPSPVSVANVSRHSFSTNASSTYAYQGWNTSLTYPGNEFVEVSVSMDVVTVMGYGVNAGFGLAVEECKHFQSAAYDGVLGLALDTLNHLARETVLERLADVSGITPMFSVYLPPYDAEDAFGEMMFGGYDVEWFANPNDSPLSGTVEQAGMPPVGYDLWRLALPHVSLDCLDGVCQGNWVDGKPRLRSSGNSGFDLCQEDTPCKVLFSSSSPHVAIPAGVLGGVLSEINATCNGGCTTHSSLEDSLFCSEQACPDLSVFPNITFSLQLTDVDGATSLYDFPLIAEYYTVRDVTTMSSPQWKVMLTPHPAGSPNFLLGVPFMRSFYTIYNANTMTIGLVAAVSGVGPYSSPWNDPASTTFWSSPYVWGALLGAAVLGIIGVLVSVARRQEKKENSPADNITAELVSALLVSGGGEGEGPEMTRLRGGLPQGGSGELGNGVSRRQATEVATDTPYYCDSR